MPLSYPNRDVTIQNDNEYIYIKGDESTDGSWRMIVVDNDLEAQRRESGVWVSKGAFVP